MPGSGRKGLPVPRSPAEIVGGAGGREGLREATRVMDATGRDVSAPFREGAEQALRQPRSRHIRIAVLKEGSPSCRTGYTYDGSFTGSRVPLPSVSAARLQEAGVRVFSEGQLEESDDLLKHLEGEAAG